MSFLQQRVGDPTQRQFDATGQAAKHGALTVYRLYYLDSADRIAAADVIYCDADAEAQARADKLLAASNHSGIEVWDRVQVVYRAWKTEMPP
jgi:hypothetical protein